MINQELTKRERRTVFNMADGSPQWPAPSEAEMANGATIALAQVLAGGGDPAPQLSRARALLDTVGGLTELLRASPEQLAATGVLQVQEVALLIAVQHVARSQRCADRPEISSFRALQKFLRAEKTTGTKTETRALLLEHQHRLKADVVLAGGKDPLTDDQLRHLVRSCLEHRALGVIIARWVGRGDPPVLGLAREATVVARSLEMLHMPLLDYALVDASSIRRVRWCHFNSSAGQA